jgi:drug/metabolite transporter (DMT)-like permease
LALTVIWGVNFSVVKAALDFLNPLALNALRFPLAGLVLWVMVQRRSGPPADPRDFLGLIVLGIVGNVAYQMCFILGIDATLAGNASLLLATSPVWTVLLSAAVGHERPNALVYAGSTLTLGGMVLVVIGGGKALSLGHETLVGDGLMILGAFLWATYTVGSSRYIRKYGPVRVTAWTLWIGTPFLVALGAPALWSTDWAGTPTWVWGAVVYAGVFSVAVAYLLWYRGVQQLGNSRTAVYSNLVPVVALLTAWLWLGEIPTLLQAGGAGIILSGIYLARRRKTLQPPEPRAGR